MDDDQQFCLRWNNHQSTLISVFDTLLENGTLVDCTLAAEGKFLKAHKVVLCACSPYFASLLSQQYDKHPIFILKDVKFQELRAMMDYMYRGEVNISQDQLAALLKAAESLQIKGLSDNRSGSSAKGVDNAQQKQQVPVSGGAAGSAAKTGLTIEQNNKRPNAELPGDREGSTSPLSRKRKRVRRRSVDTNNAAATIDNHDQMSNSSSQSATQQAQPITSTPLTLSQITTATSAANVLNVTKKTDNNSNDDDDDDDDEEPTIVRHKTRNTDGSNKDKIDSELLIEPKSEYEDGNDETVEDLTMADEELMEDMEQAGPSHGGEGSSQGYTQWQVDRSQDEVYLATQEAGQHRDAQGQAEKKRASVNAAVVPKTTPTVVPTIAKAQNGTSTVPSQPTAELPQSAASVSARKEPVATVAVVGAAPPNAKNDTENIKPDSGDGSSTARPLVSTQNPLTAIMNEKSMVLTTNQTRLTRQYRQRVRIKYSGERSTRVNLLNERSTTKENIPKAVKPSGTKNDTQPMDKKLGENLVNMNKGDSSSGQTTASVKASAAAAHKVKKKARKIASATNVKIQRTYKIDGKSGDKLFPCRHCGRKYRWKSTLRRHENDECGNKEPSHQCPYCPYKAKQRGNLGVHVRKHHSDKPKLESCRKRKTI